jgi:hypothetical protein
MAKEEAIFSQYNDVNNSGSRLVIAVSTYYLNIIMIHPIKRT